MNTSTPSTDRKRTLAINTTALTVGRLGSKVLVFLLVRFYTHVLTKEQFGTADLITSLANFLIPLACAGLSSGFFRFAAEAKGEQEASRVFSSGLSILLVASMGFALLSPVLFAVPHVSSYVYLVLVYVLCANLHYFISDFIRAQGHYQLFALQGLLNTALNIAFNLLFLLAFSMGVEGYVLSIVLADLITSILLIVCCRLWRYVRPGAADRRMLRSMLRYCLPLIPASVCWWITNASDRYMVTYFCGSHVNGIYSAAYKIPTVINLVSSIFMQAWQFSAVAESSDGEACQSFYSQVFRGFLSVIMIGSSILVLMSRFLTGLLLNSAYFEAWRYMPTLLCAVAIESIVSFLATVYMVRKKSMHSFLTAMIGTILNLLLNFLLIPGQGALGAAIATLAAYCAVMVARLIDVRRMIPFRLCLPRLCSSVLLLLLAAGAMTYEVSGRLWWTSLCVLLTIAMNLPALWKSFRGLLQFRGKKKMQ